MLYCFYDFLLSCVIGQSFACISVMELEICKTTILFNFQNLLLGSLLSSPSHSSLCIQVFLTFAQLAFNLYICFSIYFFACNKVTFIYSQFCAFWQMQGDYKLPPKSGYRIVLSCPQILMLFLCRQTSPFSLIPNNQWSVLLLQVCPSQIIT